MPIKPAPADIGRPVRLELFDAEPMRGELVEVRGRDKVHAEPYARVLYAGERFPVDTELDRLEWGDALL